MSVGHSTGHGTPRRHSGQVSGQRALTAVPYYVQCVVSARCMSRAVHRSQFTQPPAAAPPPTRAAPISVQSGGGGGACGRATDRLRSTATLDRLRTHTIGPLQL